MSLITDLPSSAKWMHEDSWERLTPYGWEAQAQFVLDWADTTDFANVCGGQPQSFTIGSVTYTRIVPLQYPYRDNCYCDSLELWGVGASREPAGAGYGIEYDKAIARVHFGPVPWALDNNTPMFTWQEDIGAEMVTRPGTAYKFPSDNLRLTQNAGVRVPTSDFVLTAHNVQVYDPTNSPYRAYAGMVNSATFLNFAAGTVQYLGLATAGQTTIGNVTSWQLSHKFKWRAIDHNKIMRPDGAAFEAPVELTSGNTLLPTGDLNPILG